MSWIADSRARPPRSTSAQNRAREWAERDLGRISGLDPLGDVPQAQVRLELLVADDWFADAARVAVPDAVQCDTDAREPMRAQSA